MVRSATVANEIGAGSIISPLVYRDRTGEFVGEKTVLILKDSNK